MNKPTARFFSACLSLGYDDDAIRIAQALVASEGKMKGDDMGFGRDRRWNALHKIAPSLAQSLEYTKCDIVYVHEFSKGDIRRARAAWQEGLKAGPKQAWISFLTDMEEKKAYEIIRVYAQDHLTDEVDKATAGIPLPRDAREALARGGMGE